ncbi:MAG: hypothetical protein M3440_06145 [Chloroflexota bacterium]|nr:hypothetical protein [Chloroflexota bacterium]
MSAEKPTSITSCAKPDCHCRPDDDRVLWIAVRRGLLTIVRAIESKYQIEDKGKKAA